MKTLATLAAILQVAVWAVVAWVVVWALSYLPG